jgi:hypothetical protein
MTVLGKRQVRLLTNREVTESLKSGELNISILSVDHLPDIASYDDTRHEDRVRNMKGIRVMEFTD